MNINRLLGKFLLVITIICGLIICLNPVHLQDQEFFFASAAWAAFSLVAALVLIVESV